MIRPIEQFSGEHRFLSNFYSGHSFRWRGEIWPTAEHAYQAAKCVHPEEAERIRLLPTPGMTKRLGRRVTMRKDFDEIKVDLMAEILDHKFRDPVLRKKLLETDHAVLIEGNTWRDTFWGQHHGQGQNRLGLLLMDLRNQLRRDARLEVTASAPAPQP